MRFLIDESAGAAVAVYLRDAGHDVLSVAELTPQARDADILAWALRPQDDNAANRVRILAAVLADHREHLEDHFVVATGTVVRIRAATEQHDIP